LRPSYAESTFSHGPKKIGSEASQNWKSTQSTAAPGDYRCGNAGAGQRVQHELSPPEGMDLAKDLAVMLRQVWRLWRQDSMGSLYRLILSEMMLDKEGARYLREIFIPRRQAFTAIAFQTAKDRGEIPQETDIKLLMDLLYGYSLFRLITGQLDDDQIPDRIGATIAKLARSGVPNPDRAEKRPRIKHVT
jgi:hypothetical protein